MKTMKNAILTILIIISFGLCANAQSDGFFGGWDDGGERVSSGGVPAVPRQTIGSTENENAPVGSGLLILTAFGAGYSLTKRRK